MSHSKIETNKQTKLKNICLNGTALQLKSFLKKHKKEVDLNFQYKDGKCLLLYCSYRKGTLEILLQHGADVNMKHKNGETVLHLLVNWNPIFFELLLSYTTNINVQSDNGNTPLHCACANNRIHNVKLLIKHGADINIKNNKNESPAFSAVKLMNTALINVLIRHGADLNFKVKGKHVLHLCSVDLTTLSDYINVRDKNGNTPLSSAIIRKSSYFVQNLLDLNVDVNIKNKDGLTALHYFCICSISFFRLHKEILRKIIHRTNDINLKTKKGYTPLHYVCQFNIVCGYNTVKILLENGAIRDIQNKRGETPLDLLLKKSERIRKTSSNIQRVIQLLTEYFPVNPYNEILIFGFISENSSLFNFVRNSAFDKNLLPLIYCFITGQQNKAFNVLQNHSQKHLHQNGTNYS